MIKYIKDTEHYKEVLSRASSVKRSLWIGTADLKDLHVEGRPFLGILSDLVKAGKEVRLLHATVLASEDGSCLYAVFPVRTQETVHLLPVRYYGNPPVFH